MWNVIQCAVPGRSHIKLEIPCQDKTYCSNVNNVQVIALADGAGSAKFSHFGAEAVTKFICEDLTKNFEHYFFQENGIIVKQQLMKSILNCLSNQRENLGCNLKDLASTLLVVGIKDERFMIVHIGDGVIGYLKENELKIASYPENGEFVNTTIFTTSKDALTTMKIIKGSLGSIRGFILMSDGSEASLYNKREKKLADVLKRIMEKSIYIVSNRLEEQLQDSFENVIRQATTDDCSIILLMNDKDEFKGYNNASRLEKCKLLQLNSKTSKKRLKPYDEVLTFAQEAKTLEDIAHHIHIKPKYTKRRLNRLYNLNFIEIIDNTSTMQYKTLVKL